MAKNKNTVVEFVETTTEIEAPYELPEGWKWVRFGDIAEDMADGPFGSNLKTEHYTTNKEVRIIQLSNIGENGWRDENIRYTTFEHSKNIQRSLVEPGNIVIAKMMPAGRAIICPNYEKQYVLSSDCVKMKPKEFIDTKYLLLGINSTFFQNQVQENTQGITRARTSISKLREYAFPLPSTLEEQQRIVNRIEILFAKLDQAKEKAQNVVDTFETRKASILHKAFNNQLKIDNEELKDEDWVETTIGECCKLGSGGTPSKSHPEYYEKGDIPWLNTGEIDWNEISTVEKKITQIGVDNSSAKLYPAESVVVAMYGMGVTRGKAAIIKIPTTTNQAVCVLQTGEKLNNRFLFYYFMCNYWNFREKAVGGNQLNYSATMISKWKIKLPPINYQLSIVNFLDVILEKETKAKEAAEAVLEQIDLLKKSILARAFRGEL